MYYQSNQNMMHAMTIQQKISHYVNDCINNRDMGFKTDFGIGRMVSAHVFYNNKEMVVTILSTKETKGFSIENPDDVTRWIYEKIK